VRIKIARGKAAIAIFAQSIQGRERGQIRGDFAGATCDIARKIFARS